MSLVKLSVLAAAFFLINIWAGLANWVQNTSAWWFLIAAIVFAIKPLAKAWGK